MQWQEARLDVGGDEHHACGKHDDAHNAENSKMGSEICTEGGDDEHAAHARMVETLTGWP